jgi:hypothetical protein
MIASMSPVAGSVTGTIRQLSRPTAVHRDGAGRDAVAAAGVDAHRAPPAIRAPPGDPDEHRVDLNALVKPPGILKVANLLLERLDPQPRRVQQNPGRLQLLGAPPQRL